MNQTFQIERIQGGLWGAMVGDALGVPVEFRDRATVQAEPVTGMREYGTHRQPRGTWSDDGSMILCTVDSLLNHEFDIEDLGRRFVRWMDEDLWTPHGDVFDMGGTTATALRRISKGTPAAHAGGQHEDSNGNGSLMRILPVALRFSKAPTDSLIAKLEQASAVTHAHARSTMACAFFGLVTRKLLSGTSPLESVSAARVEFNDIYKSHPEFSRFNHILEDDFALLPEGEVVSTGYVLHTLHASLWCLLNTQTFSDCVLRAVNLGGDTDTTGCVAGGLAGVAYGKSQIPKDWIHCLARRGELDCLFTEFSELCESK